MCALHDCLTFKHDSYSDLLSSVQTREANTLLPDSPPRLIFGSNINYLFILLFNLILGFV